jgi:DNA-binding winged helix-turn-helix (wHTH) protein
MPATIESVLEAAEPFLVGDWLVEPTLNRLTRGDTSVQLELKAMDVLLCLAEHAGEVVSKHELFDAVWQTEFVSDNTLARRVADLRDAFGDDAQNPRYIDTIRKRGYRLIAYVNVTGAPEAPAATFPEAPPTEVEELNPYPGLAPFTEADAVFFLGRETEVAALWRKISSRRLLAVVGPSGIGKTSLLRAGVVPAAPAGWRALVLTPGEVPSLALGRALAPDHAGDPATVTQLVGFTDPDTALAVVSRWRGQWRGAVLIVDQFEELFTLNPPEVQEGFIELLRRLVDAADVHVVLSVRDDFLLQCHRFPMIAPVFKDLTPIGPPNSEALRRAIKEPAARQLVRFESEVLVDEMIAEVEAERGALPLLAFAVHRLWQERDRERRMLTREAYLRIGGVAGALARHAEATLDRIGSEHLPLVRELFRRTSLELSYVSRKSSDLFDDTCNGNIPEPTPGSDCDFLIVTNLPEARLDYEAWMLRFETRALDWLHLLASWVVSDTKGSMNVNTAQDESFDIYPYHFANRYGYLPDQSRHRVKLKGYLLLPHDFSIAINGWWDSDWRWTPVDWEVPGMPYGRLFLEPRGNRVAGAYHQLDLQLGKGFNIGPTQLELLARVFNVFDSECTWDVCGSVTGCGGYEIGDTIAWQQPRRYELGFRIEF